MFLKCFFYATLPLYLSPMCGCHLIGADPYRGVGTDRYSDGSLFRRSVIPTLRVQAPVSQVLSLGLGKGFSQLSEYRTVGISTLTRLTVQIWNDRSWIGVTGGRHINQGLRPASQKSLVLTASKLVHLYAKSHAPAVPHLFPRQSVKMARWE